MILINTFPNKISIFITNEISVFIGGSRTYRWTVPDWEGMNCSHFLNDMWLPPRDFRQAMRDIPGDSTCPPCSRLSPILCDPIDCSLPGSSIQGILQVGILKSVAILPPRDLPYPGIEPASRVFPELAVSFFTTSSTWDAPSLSLTSPQLCHHPQLVSMETSQFKQ